MSTENPAYGEMNERTRAVFRALVETYLESGEPVGSRTLTRNLAERVSPATVRNVMQDLELLGLLDSPHVSAGRIPTHQGLRLFVDGFIESGEVASIDRSEIERAVGNDPGDLSGALERASDVLSGLTNGASLVLTPQVEAPIRHIEFVSLSAEKALVVMVTADGQVENRIFTPPAGLPPSAMREAANFLNAILEGRTLAEARAIVDTEIAKRRQELDQLAQGLVETGVAVWAEGQGAERDRLIVRGTSHLLDGGAAEDDLDRIRQLFDDIERKRDLTQLLDLTEDGDGVRVFIGSENKLFSLSGSSLVVSPYMNADRKIIGAIGVIGPTRLNYGRIVPIVDYTAQLVGRLMLKGN
ncbi:heat-inducible transcriptional repressor HrcA [Pontivivens insulae]|uniref:Heat-inducible transcription repressor HrcA n=1 Tax=Pontivivens insulae TaxID=1639689 RepID=A0A2R8A7N7_9RHOB|nr:heat-inducible transcriptional repressor HrcA [Pontivivens insulae]RED18346.1 heat-inducible transcription repressor HrcA [Pontivivens insulae]SPF28244.1 Heat-inducible transcription repressor HrcA [Pontivivens insulae]